MKTLSFKLSDRIAACKRILAAAACLFSGVLTSSATVTVQGWWHYGEVADYYADASTNSRRFSSAFSCAGSGNADAGVEPFGCGGPLGTTGFTSTSCLYWNVEHCTDAAMWNPASTIASRPDPLGCYNPPASNYVIECWVLPVGTGIQGGSSSTWFFTSGSGDFTQPTRSSGTGPGGVYFDIATTSSNSQISAWVIANSSQGVATNTQIGDFIPADTTRWMHVAVVNDNGTNTFYVNGVQNGPSTTANTIPLGNIYAGGSQGTAPTFDGYLDELRISTFAPGAFSTNDLLTRPLSPDITTEPQSEVVWTGGAAPFTVNVAYDLSTTYQWQLGGSNISGANEAEYYLNVVSAGGSGNIYSCQLSNSSGVAVTSSNATLTVVSNNPANIAAYRDAVTAEPSLVAYYTVDNDTGAILTDTVSTNNGALEGTAEYDGRTNRAFGSRALRLKNSDDGDATMPNNPAFEFGQGQGTIEAIVYLDQALAAGNETIFAEAAEYSSAPNPTYYEIQTSPAGNSLVYDNDSLTEPLTWALPVPLLGRAAHVAIVFTNSTVTAYVDGLSLGTQPNPSFGSSTGEPFWVGSSGGLNAPSGQFAGDIDELAVYSNALSANTIAIHNSKFIYGTNTTGPSIAVAPFTGSETLLAGGLVSFTVGGAGTAPLSYQWTSNSVPIPGATAATLTISRSTTNQSGTYSVIVSNPYGSTNSPAFNLTFVAPTNAYTTMIMGDNPMAFWQLDETAGTNAFDSAGGHNGVYNLPSELTLGQLGMPGISNTAVHFEGGYVQVPFAPVLNPASAFSVEFWCNPDNEPAATYVLGGSQYRSGSARDGWAIYDDNDAYSFEIQLGDANGVAYYAFGPGSTPNPVEAFGGHWYYTAAIWDGTNTLSMYTENMLVGQNSQVDNGGIYTPNASAPLVIAIRNDYNYAFNGLIQDFAVYNYALSLTQISNHWSAQFVPPKITQEPVGVTNVEFSTVTLSAQAAGYPNTYQWFFNNQPLQNSATNADGTLHYPDGVSSTNLEISETVPASDSGTYFLGVTNPIGDTVSSNATVLITPNTVPPAVESVIALGTPGTPNTTYNANAPFLVKVVFTKRVSYATGSTIANYTFSPAVTINSMTLLGQTANDIAAANLGADYREALLATAGLKPGQQYSLTISGLKDQSETPLTVPTTTKYFRAPVLTPGVVNWDYYYVGTNDGNAQQVATLQADPNFQAGAPQTNTYFTAFDSHQITGGTLSDNPIFGALGDNYGDCVSGWITPTVSDTYTFFLDSDDEAALYLSSNTNAGNVSQIVSNPKCCTGFLETNNSTVIAAGGLGFYVSNPQALTAGQSYYIQTLHGQGGGGDYVRVAWRGTISTDQNTPAADLEPIPGTYLSAYENVPPQFSSPVLTNGTLTLNWSGYLGIIQQSTDLLNWTNVPGNPSPLVVSVNSGTNTLFFRLIESP